MSRFLFIPQPSGPSLPTPLLDVYSTNVWWSLGLRKMRTAYTGNAIKVRRSSDNALLDIGFSGLELDTASLLSFIGSNTGYVETWYDQSGNSAGGDFFTTGDYRPIIVDSGTLVTSGVNNRPAISFNSARLRSTKQLFAYMTSPIVTNKYQMVHGAASSSNSATYNGVITSKKAGDDLSPNISFVPTSTFLTSNWRGSGAFASTITGQPARTFGYYHDTSFTVNGAISGTQASINQKYYKNGTLDTSKGPSTQLYGWISDYTELGSFRVGNNPGGTAIITEITSYSNPSSGTALLNDAAGIEANIEDYLNGPYPLLVGLQNYFKFDETSGTTATDIVGSAVMDHNGAAIVPGKINNGIDIQAGDYPTMTSGTPFTFTKATPFTMSFWYKPSDVTSTVVLFDKQRSDLSSRQGYECYIVGNELGWNIFGDFNAGKFIGLVFPADLTIGNWYQFLFEYNGNGDASGFNLYINNVLISKTVGTNNISDADFNGNSNFKFGVYNDNSIPALGVADELASWNRVLTDTEKADLYNAGSGRQYPF